jgi:hypothetical protein
VTVRDRLRVAAFLLEFRGLAGNRGARDVIGLEFHDGFVGAQAALLLGVHAHVPLERPARVGEVTRVGGAGVIGLQLECALGDGDVAEERGAAAQVHLRGRRIERDRLRADPRQRLAARRRARWRCGGAAQVGAAEQQR